MGSLIKDFVFDICDILNIEVPSISYDTSNFQSSTMMAQCDIAGRTIYLKKADRIDPDYIFSVAHELRHIWQIKYDEELYFSNYQTVDLIGVEEYNSQLAEVDANAFATIVMIDFFNIKPLWNGLSDKNIKLIKNRMEVIAQSFEFF